MTRIQIALATDMAFLQPTLTAMASALEHASAPATVHLLGDRLPADAVESANALCQRHSAALAHRDLAELLEGAPETVGISRIAMGRMFLPRFVEGRTLHLDSDTMTFGDVAPLFALDMKGAPLGAVRDYAILDTFRRSWSRGMRKYGPQAILMAPHPITDYVNSGVLLMDCDRIREDPEMAALMADMAAATGRFPDQDLLNSIFRGRVIHLGPEWNSPWGRMDRARKVAESLVPDERFPQDGAPVIVHFPGRKKPWQRLDVFRRLKHRKILARYRAAFHRLRLDVG